MPTGDNLFRFRVLQRDAGRAEEALREAGFAVGRDDASDEDDPEEPLAITAGWTPHAVEGEPAPLERAAQALAAAGVGFRVVATGVLVKGGTPEHRWVDVVVDGEPVGLTILVADDDEADAELDRIARELSVERERVNIAPPPGWAGYGAPDAET